jgi:hypothetical protein
MGYGTSVSLSDIKQHIDLRDPADAQALIMSLGSSLYTGIEILFKLQVEPDFQKLLTDLVSECVRLAHRMPLVRFDFDIVRGIIDHVEEKILVKFLYEVANIKEFKETTLLAAYMRCHPEFDKLEQRDSDLIESEKLYKIEHGAAPEAPTDFEVAREIPSLQELIKRGQQFGEGEGQG